MAAGTAGLVAVGIAEDDRAAIWLSTDDGEWEQIPTGGDGGPSELAGVTWHDDRYLTVGTETDASDGERPTAVARRPGVWESTDGRRWQRQPVDRAVPGENARLAGVAAAETGERQVVAVGCLLDDDAAEAVGGLVLVRDGEEWVRASAPTQTAGEGALTGVVHAGERWLAVGSDPDGPLAWRSAEGWSWEIDQPTLEALQGIGLHDVVVDDAGLHVSGTELGEHRVRRFSSTDGGATWHEDDLDVLGAASDDPHVTVRGLTSLGGSVVGVGAAAGQPTLGGRVRRVGD